jgi:NACalpha-BTF3-like transcription factor
MQVSTLRPGLLVALKTSVRGNVMYSKRDIEQDHIDANGQRRAVWETRRVVQDPAEFERATQVRGKARTLVTAVCAASNFGLLCAEADADKLAGAVAEAREVVTRFNQDSRLTHIDIYLIAARVASDDKEAIRAINSEVRDLLNAMEEGIRNLDVEAVRTAANKAKGMGKILSPYASNQVQMAIDAARSVARKMAKAGEGVAVEIDRAVLNSIRSARTEFLDLDDTDATGSGEAVQPVVVGRAVDFDAAPPMAAAPVAQASMLLFD